MPSILITLTLLRSVRLFFSHKLLLFGLKKSRTYFENPVIKACVPQVKIGLESYLGPENNCAQNKACKLGKDRAEIHLVLLQWGSKIGTLPDFKWLTSDWVSNGPALERHLKTRSLTICKPSKMAAIFNVCLHK